MSHPAATPPACCHRAAVPQVPTQRTMSVSCRFARVLLSVANSSALQCPVGDCVGARILNSISTWPLSLAQFPPAETPAPPPQLCVGEERNLHGLRRKFDAG